MRTLYFGALMAATILTPAAADAAQANIHAIDRSGIASTEISASAVAQRERGERRGEARQERRSERRADRRAERRQEARRDRRQDARQFERRAERRREARRDRRQDARQDQRRAERRAERRRDYRREQRREAYRDYRQDRREAYRDYRRDRRADYRRDRYNNARFAYNGRQYNRWNNNWRNDRRYDWRRYRRANRGLFTSRYYAPYRNYGYRRLSVGGILGSLFYSNRYRINDPYRYRLPPVYGPYRWVRYFGDAVLVDVRNGRTVDVIYDFFY
ncbi:RcnB family protein [Novosphingopyxis sp. YJ-S2-01]|uniref:RcnB family protein n=1 Tax=Novosphingopyxis sp. YJ-S2-01 TaxID=2794021 RepID=UPI0018DB1C0F|nr:RcnB family protein [Novosphingopyxis sp. YJ-S2-01]MBH9538828.1 RcnB family protein [Novosphingopyxis sp. YJ-S2-01]